MMTITRKPLNFLLAAGLAAVILQSLPGYAQTAKSGAMNGPALSTPSETTQVGGTLGSSNRATAPSARPVPRYQEAPRPGIPGGEERLRWLKENPPRSGYDNNPPVRLGR